jgi:hypothetical protein
MLQSVVRQRAWRRPSTKVCNVGCLRLGGGFDGVEGFEWQNVLGYRVAPDEIRLLVENEEMATSGRLL